MVPARHLSKLCQIEFVKDYQTKFKGMATKVHGISKKVLKEVLSMASSPRIKLKLCGHNVNLLMTLLT